MNDSLAEATIKDCYRVVWRQYRSDDEIEVKTENHRRLETMLRRLTSSFGRPVRVLEAGCGTGRYFHCLENVEDLVGMDISPEMLRAAQRPVRSGQITAKHITLLCGNVHRHQFDPHTFDLIYSLGMFGNGCPVNVEVCDRFYEWLKPGGKLFFDAIQQTAPRFYIRGRELVRRCVYSSLPRRMQRSLDARRERHPFYQLTKPELEEILQNSRFEGFEVFQHSSPSPLATGRRLECLACKT